MTQKHTATLEHDGLPTMFSANGKALTREPLKRGASIDHLEYLNVTPIIGCEYTTAKLKDMLNAPNAEDQLRDLAITICERGVVVFRARQDDLSVGVQKHITDKLGKLTGRPAENGMHWTRGACATGSNECTFHAATVSCPPCQRGALRTGPLPEMIDKRMLIGVK